MQICAGAGWAHDGPLQDADGLPAKRTHPPGIADGWARRP
jgi:hypothetical protein